MLQIGGFVDLCLAEDGGWFGRMFIFGEGGNTKQRDSVSLKS